ncbi:uncharacterized protein LOC119632157 [Glossina fuscipes]|uniref:Uncharacterized protein LOC119632157 n=1 Tax=Glossina fuscipes TaxID=7396 RepID=A0A8U0W6M5_9MUSC|nr:uncharacterized protein LOC119632157 [Glossina fuscipes]
MGNFDDNKHTMTAPYKLKRLSVRVNRLSLVARVDPEIRDQVIFRRCTVRLQRYSPDELRYLASTCENGPTSVADENFSGHKLRRLCIRLPRMPLYARSDISSRASSAICSEAEPTDLEDDETVY